MIMIYVYHGLIAQCRLLSFRLARQSLAMCHTSPASFLVWAVFSTFVSLKEKYNLLFLTDGRFSAWGVLSLSLVVVR
jgi:hypothetical protein